MPPVRMFGRKWRVSSDFLPVFAGIGLIFHFAWVIFIIVWPFGITKVHMCIDTKAGRQFLAAVCLFFGLYVLSFIQELLITLIGLRGPIPVLTRCSTQLCTRKINTAMLSSCCNPTIRALTKLLHRHSIGDKKAQSYDPSLVYTISKLDWSTRGCE